MTSTATVLLPIVSRDGVAAWRDPFTGPGFRFLQAVPPWSFDNRQPGDIEITIRHGGPQVGQVQYLDVGEYADGALMAVGVVEGVPADMIDGAVYCSPEITSNAMYDVRSSTGTVTATTATLEAVALVDATANVGVQPARAWDGSYLDPIARGHWDQRTVPSVLRRAIEAATWDQRWKWPSHQRIHRHEHDLDEHRYAGAEIRYSAPHFGGVLAVRSA